LDVLFFSFNAVSPLFIVIFLGWFIARRGLLQEKEITFLNALCFRYLLPLYIFNNTLKVDFYTEFNPKMFLAFLICDSFILIAAWILFSLLIKNKGIRCIYIVNAFRSNNLIYALPLAYNLFKETGLKSASMLVPFTIIFFNLYSVIVMVYHAGKIHRDKKTRYSLKTELPATLIEIIKNPLIIGSASGILISLSGIEIPHFLYSGLNYAAAAASPVSLLLLGSQINFSKLRQNSKHTIANCAIRLIICPVIITPALIFIGFRGPDLSTLAAAFAAPCAISTFLMSRNYNIEPQFAAQTVYLSTVFSILSIFLLITILRALEFL
jgi:predicted permease